MLGQRRRRWANINPALVQRLVSARLSGPLRVSQYGAGSIRIQPLDRNKTPTRECHLPGLKTCAPFSTCRFSSSSIVLCKAERQYPLAWTVSRCCLLALHGSIVYLPYFNGANASHFARNENLGLFIFYSFNTHVAPFRKVPYTHAFEPWYKLTVVRCCL